jgi:hypothetical protein
MLGFNGGLIGVPRAPTAGAATGLWLPNEQSMARRAGQWPVANDPFLGDVTALFLMNGDDESTAFVDSGPDGKAVTVLGNAQLSTAASQFGGSSALFDGSGDALRWSGETFAGDFTAELWWNAVNALEDRCMLGATLGTSGNQQIFRLNEDSPSSGGITVYANSYAFSRVVPSPALTSGVFNHIALTRNGQVLRLFLNGLLVGTNSNYTSTFFIDTIGAGYAGSNNYWRGYLDCVRFTAACRYTAPFSVPATELPVP